ncbi:MAG: YbhB/YbcL family Raf kinase inhibitor-like protein [Pseudomonadota bacterium]|nr:YbhB/YbcL family Raf kinase inhibitor-like protein [Pseudomonadota bacterium]
MALVLTSPAFEHGQHLPRRLTCEGENLSPRLDWKNLPPGTKSLVMIMDDPDAPNGTFHHWAMYNIPAGTSSLEEGAGTEGKGQFAINDFGHRSYDGPLPPRGHGKHRYYFKLMALDVGRLDVPDDAKVLDVAKMARSHILAQAELMGTYERS